jgi:hypothetical protein
MEETVNDEWTHYSFFEMTRLFLFFDFLKLHGRIKNTLKPQWTKTVTMEYTLGVPTTVIISVFDDQSSTETSKKSMGSAVFEIGQVLGSRGSIKAKSCKGGGTIFLQVRLYCDTVNDHLKGKLTLQLRGLDLTNREGFGLLRKSDPFYELSRRVSTASGVTWDNIFRSPSIKNSLNPEWDAVDIELASLSVSQESQLENIPILIQVFDFEGSGNHVLMGESETTLRALLDMSGQHAPGLTLTRNDHETGRIQVRQAVAQGLVDRSVNDQMSNLKIEANHIPTFADYIAGGCTLNTIVAIDFTGSNGDPTKEGTLHYVSSALNDYEKAITSILSVLANYDPDQKYPTYGFGAKFDGKVHHCFPLSRDMKHPALTGIDGVLDGYHSIFHAGFIMSSPTVFVDVIAKAAQHARVSQQLSSCGSYTILLIITDGAVTDPNATVKALQEVIDAPLSVVIVGVGTEDFSSMKFLDDIETTRDIVQFVEFNQCQAYWHQLAKATLGEIPQQLVSYFLSHDIQPYPAITASEEDIVVEKQEEEIDLCITKGQDEEIIVSSNA